MRALEKKEVDSITSAILQPYAKDDATFEAGQHDSV